MKSDQLSTKLEELVNCLRENREHPVSIRDIASVTEVLISAVRRYFTDLDTSIYRELNQLSAHITETKTEIADLRPGEIKAQIPVAGDQLGAIVKSTELATNTIMEAAEEIMAGSGDDAAAHRAAVEDACMRIFEACSFQDITGQRVTKVVKTLSHIDERLTTLLEALGAELADIPVEPESQPEGDAALMTGPALEGEGIDQDEVDALLNGPGPASGDSAHT